MLRFHPDYWIEIRDTTNASWQSVPGTRHDRPHHYHDLEPLFDALIIYAKRPGPLNGVRIMSQQLNRKPIAEREWTC